MPIADSLSVIVSCNNVAKYLPDTVLWYRRHDSNITGSRALSNHYLIRALKLSLDRRRVEGNQHLRDIKLPVIPENA